MSTKTVTPPMSPANKAWQTRRANAATKAKPKPTGKANLTATVTARQVIDAIANGDHLLRQYVKEQVAQGKDESKVRAAIKAHVVRRTA